MYCQECGTKVLETAKFCSECGRKIHKTGGVTEDKPKKILLREDALDDWMAGQEKTSIAKQSNPFQLVTKRQQHVKRG